MENETIDSSITSK